MFDQYLAHLLSSLNSHPGLIYLVVFLAAIIEALPAVGTLFPGHTIVIFSGILVLNGGVSGVLLAVAASIGAIIGDGISYVFGRRYGSYFLNHERPAVRRAMKVSHDFFRKYGFSSLILGRFTSVTRAFVPAIAGSSKMDQKKFWTANIIGGILWGSTAILLGYGIARGYSVLHTHIGIYAFLVLLGIVMLWFFYIYVARRLLKHPHVQRFLLSATMIAVFFVLLDSIGKENELSSVMVHNADAAIRAFAVSHQFLPFLWETITFLGSAFFLLPLAIVVVVLLRKRKEDFAFFSYATIIGLALDIVVKEVVGRIRPGHLDAGYSFPSGHSLMSTVIYGALFVILWRLASERKFTFKQRLLLLLLPLGVLLIGISRILLDYHWFTDVLAGFSLGIGILAGVLFFQQFLNQLFGKK